MSRHHSDSGWTKELAAIWRKRLEAELPMPCIRCRRWITEDTPRAAFEVDHIISLSEGGTNDAENLALSHKKCNRSHGGKQGAAVTNAKRIPNTREAKGLRPY
jgi:5-methylcytosine-specific restriction endonuclease McrA